MASSRTGTKGVARADREAQIVDAATEVFGTDGYATTSLETIAEQVGVSKPMIYHYFGSKTGLFTACLHHNGAIIADEIERIAREDATGLERGMRTLAGIFGILEEQPLMWRLFFDTTAPVDDEGIEAALATYTDRITGLAQEGVAELMHLAGNDDPLDVSAMVAVWMSLVDSLVNWWLEHPDESAHAMTERSARLILALYAPGVAQVPA
ncbi:MAG TPA: TetR/AcrR family transcriptional regulator [Marmoricola sp.]